jgi:hypothetical protein
MKHLYVSIEAHKHRVFKYAGVVPEDHLDFSIEAHHKFGEFGLPHTGGKGPFKVLVFDSHITDRIWEDGTPYGEKP